MPKSECEYVFQYGSNMCGQRIRAGDRIPEARSVEAAWTDDTFDFTFPVWSRTANRAACGIIGSDTGRRIFGAIYLIPYNLIDRSCARRGRKTLDVIEGEGVNYERRSIRVIGVESGQHFSALTYLPIEQSWRAPTDQEYAEYIFSGLAELRPEQKRSRANPSEDCLGLKDG